MLKEKHSFIWILNLHVQTGTGSDQILKTGFDLISKTGSDTLDISINFKG